MAGIYVHIPFCKKACHYCNFHFSTSARLQKDFVQALLKEIELQSNYLSEPISTIYFGGGTPSILPGDDLAIILDQLRQNFAVNADVEITLEANPDDIDNDKLVGWKSIGINRLSIGVQSFFSDDLQWMNRAHNAQQALNSIQLAQQHGFYNLTVDLIYGTPTLTDENWMKNIEQAVALNIPHLSCYALTVEPKTALEELIQTKRLCKVDEEKQATHFEVLMQQLSKHGYEHYEISNFAKPGYRSKHNSSYWLGRSYLGVGPSAHSFNGTSRQWNIANNAMYINSVQKGVLPFEIETLTPADRLNEYIMTSLRTSDGISLETVSNLFGADKLASLMASINTFLDNGNVALAHDHLKLTAKGKLMADGIASELFTVK
jgi:oxygen-independent coproporphyrinogen-3 oxidase